MIHFIKKYTPQSLKVFYFEMKHRIQRLRYKGGQYYCICCDTTYAHFLDMKEGSHPRKAVSCPGCGAVERHRMLVNYLEANEARLFPKGARILYIAPMLSVKKYLQQIPNTSYLGADLGSSFADVHFDLQAIPYADDSFDFCICSHTLAHVKDDILAIQELHRVLSKGGKLLIMERIHTDMNTHDLQKDLTQEERLQEYEQADRWRKYGLDFEQRITNCGFSVEVIAFAQTLDKKELTRQKIDIHESIFLASKV